MTNQRIIYQNAEGGVSVIIPTGELPIEEVANKDVPVGVSYEIVDSSAIPSDRTFRGAWVANGTAVDVDLNKAKAIAHDKRRAARDEEFEPHDEVIMKQIPGNDATIAEVARQEIRDRYAVMQSAIDAATSAGELKTILGLD